MVFPSLMLCPRLHEGILDDLVSRCLADDAETFKNRHTAAHHRGEGSCKFGYGNFLQKRAKNRGFQNEIINQQVPLFGLVIPFESIDSNSQSNNSHIKNISGHID